MSGSRSTVTATPPSIAAAASRWPSRWLVAAFVAVLFVAIQPVRAEAHTDLLSSDPADGSRVVNPPQTISLIFNEDVKPDLAAVAVTIDGASPVTLAVEQGAGTAQVVAAVPESTVARAVPNAEWTVRFRVTSADGHPIEGELGFTVKGWQAAGENSTVATPMASPSPSTAAPAAGEGGAGELAEVSSTSSGSTATSTVVIGGLAALGVAIATVLLVRARRRAVGSGE